MRTCFLLLVFLAVGCHRGVTTRPAPIAVDPAEKLHEQVSRGAYQLSTAVGDLEDAMKSAKELEAKAPAGPMRESLGDVEDSLDNCGLEIADFTDPPPDLPEFKNQIAAQTEHLKKAVQAAGDALREFYDAWGVVQSMLETPPRGFEDSLQDLSDQMEDINDELRGAIQDMGGTPPEADSSDDAP